MAVWSCLTAPPDHRRSSLVHANALPSARGKLRLARLIVDHDGPIGSLSIPTRENLR